MYLDLCHLLNINNTLINEAKPKESAKRIKVVTSKKQKWGE